MNTDPTPTTPTPTPTPTSTDPTTPTTPTTATRRTTATHPGPADDARTGTATSGPAGEETMLRLPAGRRPVPTSTRLPTRRLPVLGYALAGLLVLGGAVGGSVAMGWWSTDCGGVNEAAVAAGTLTPDEVKGSMTVRQVTEGFPAVSAADVLAFFGAPADTATSTQLKTLVQNGSDKDVTDLRTWLAERGNP